VTIKPPNLILFENNVFAFLFFHCFLPTKANVVYICSKPAAFFSFVFSYSFCNSFLFLGGAKLYPKGDITAIMIQLSCQKIITFIEIISGIAKIAKTA